MHEEQTGPPPRNPSSGIPEGTSARPRAAHKVHNPQSKHEPRMARRVAAGTLRHALKLADGSEHPPAGRTAKG